jgi:hypothetical protein
MNEEGASPGGGASPAPAETQTEPQAQGDAPVTMSALKSLLTGFRTEIATEVKNGIHADLRRSGVYDKPKPAPSAAVAQAPVEAPAAPTAAQAVPDFEASYARERAFTRVIDKAGLTPEQEAFVEETYRQLKPSDPAAWATTFLKNMGIGAKNAPVPTATQQATQVAASPAVPPKPTTNISDRGPATAGDVRDVETFVQTRPLEMTSSDFERLQLKVGREKALQMVQESVNAKLRTIRMTPDRRR